jgi:hypothetical protein
MQAQGWFNSVQVALSILAFESGSMETSYTVSCQVTAWEKWTKMRFGKVTSFHIVNGIVVREGKKGGICVSRHLKSIA